MPPNADPVLVKVKYNITFAENITEDALPNCTEFNNPESVMRIALNQIWIIHGWTSTGLYLWIEPLVLNLMQVKFPFFILCVIRLLNKIIMKGNPEMETFPWDGYDLYSVLINLHIASLPCIPSQGLFNSTVEDLTIIVSYQCMQLNTYNINLYHVNCNFLQLKVYASRGFVSEMLQHEDVYIGFTLGEKSVQSSYPITLITSIITITYCYDILGYVIV